ncbi:MAG: hypothetical protein V1754_11305 [Pseudomonadota bacterium]
MTSPWLARKVTLDMRFFGTIGVGFAFLATCFGGQVSHADPRPNILVHIQGESSTILSSVLDELSKSDNFNVLQFSALISLLRQKDETNKTLSRVNELCEQARISMLKLDHRMSKEKFQKALELLERSFVRYYDPNLIAQVHILRGVAALYMARPDLARQAFVTARHFDNKLELDSHFSPQVRAAFEQAISSLPPRPAPPPDSMASVVDLVPGTKFAIVLSADPSETNHTLVKSLLFERKSKSYSSVESHNFISSEALSVDTNAKEFSRKLRTLLNNRFGSLEKKEKPWFKQWYVWTAAGILASAAIVIPLATRSEVVDISAHW